MKSILLLYHHSNHKPICMPYIYRNDTDDWWDKIIETTFDNHIYIRDSFV